MKQRRPPDDSTSKELLESKKTVFQTPFAALNPERFKTLDNKIRSAELSSKNMR